ncbi:hypothetical protein [Winogradskyella haliclonae]|uniref:Outer membrane protein beta-barrel domain-containing protein n=1 Tax=Winogradskyella haliclonae TaxID=2048558 RepID=A0ABQ2C0T2_9FLAO|nr:hypothetical protein [Winogradskyella haliclonae]GGI56738.1 hypothetical protein GCM10011444_10470 [Winogradskyella haliclonae]
MKKMIITTLLFMFSISIVAQNDSIPNDKPYRYDSSFADYWKTVTFKIGGGVLLPQGKLNDYFGISPLVELSLDFPVTESKSLELALQFVIPDQKNGFEYQRLADRVETKATFLFNPMLRFKKNFSQSNSKKLILGVGLGASVITTDARNTDFFDTSDDRNKYEVITAFLVSPSLEYAKTFKKNNEFTLSLGLNYTPYKIEGALQEDIGSIALTPRLLYSF